jgi:hypothetical protein
MSMRSWLTATAARVVCATITQSRCRAYTAGDVGPNDQLYQPAFERCKMDGLRTIVGFDFAAREVVARGGGAKLMAKGKGCQPARLAAARQTARRTRAATADYLTRASWPGPQASLSSLAPWPCYCVAWDVSAARWGKGGQEWRGLTLQVSSYRPAWAAHRPRRRRRQSRRAYSARRHRRRSS